MAPSPKVRTDLESVLRDYDIQDKATLKEIETTLLHLDLYQNDLDAAVVRLERIHKLEEKPEARLYDRELFVIEAIIKARQKSGAATGAAYQKALRGALAESLNPLPNSLSAKLTGEKAAFGFLSGDFFLNSVKSRIAPMAKERGNTLPGEVAFSLVEIRTLHRLFVPAGEDIAQAFGTYLAAHKSVNTDIWTSRAVTLTNEQKLTPVIVGIWDKGVDVKVFSSQLFINRAEKPNGKDNDGNGFAADVNGIGFDFEENNTPALLYPLKQEDLKQYPEYIKDWRAAADLKAGIDNEATRALKQKIQFEKPEDAAKEIRLDRVMSSYLHGTHVAGIAVEGNPAARILNARLTWRDQSGQPDSVAEDAERAGRIAANIKTFVDYFKKHNVRVVNMSWSMTRTTIDENLAKTKPTLTAQERKIEADKSFTIIKNALVEAFRSAPEILFVCSAGNTNSDAGFNEGIPSSLELPNLITVGAVDASGAAANFTSFGKTVRLYAQGVDVEAPNPGGEKLKFGGTSFAAPQMSNLAAKIFALNPKLSVAQVVQLMRESSEQSSSDKRLMLINAKRTVELLLSRMVR